MGTVNRSMTLEVRPQSFDRRQHLWRGEVSEATFEYDLHGGAKQLGRRFVEPHVAARVVNQDEAVERGPAQSPYLVGGRSRIGACSVPTVARARHTYRCVFVEEGASGHFLADGSIGRPKGDVYRPIGEIAATARDAPAATRARTTGWGVRTSPYDPSTEDDP